MLLAGIARADEVEAEFRTISAAGLPYGCEADIVRLFRMQMAAAQPYEDRIPLHKQDTVVYEMAFKYGRADIVVFHIDGTASVIEVKDGTKGYRHVVAGIGQSGLYAAQLGMNNGGLKLVRRCLLWTSTGDLSLDGLIGEACERAGVVALPWGALGVHLAYSQAVKNVYQTK